MEVKTWYAQLLYNRSERESLIQKEFYDKQREIAKKIVNESLSFGNQVIVKEKNYQPLIIFEVDWSKLEDNYIIEFVESKSGWTNHFDEQQQKYVKTFVITRKDEDLNSLPLCIQIVFYPTNVTVHSENVSFDSIGLTYPSKIEVYADIVTAPMFRFEYYRKSPILIKECVKPSKEILQEFINSKEGMTIGANLKNKSIIGEFSSIFSLKNYFLSEEDSKNTLENVVENIIKKSIIEQFDLYCINKLDKPSNYFYTLMNDLIGVRMIIERKKFVSDVEVGARYHYIWGTLKNKEYDAILITAVIKIKGTDYKKVLRYCGTDFIHEMDLKELLNKLLS